MGIDSSLLEIYPESLNLYALLSGISGILGEALEQRRQTLLLEPDLQSLPAVEGDEAAIVVVFTKLIENAIKYTPDGGHIRLSGRPWTTPPRNDLPENAVEVIISDTGIGIDARSLELIFSKFYSTSKSLLHSSGKTKFKGGGPGLGLAIARGIVEAHQGRLWAESPGHDEDNCPGSNFHVVLPVKHASNPGKPGSLKIQA